MHSIPHYHFIIISVIIRPVFGPSVELKESSNRTRQVTERQHNKNLSGKIFTFPQKPTQPKSFTDLSRAHSYFSLATPSLHNGLLIFKETAVDTVGSYVANQVVHYVVDYELNAWHSVCFTWDSESGLGQLWFDGKPSVRRFITDQSTTCCPWTGIFTILTKNEKDQEADVHEQDSYGGKFDIKQSFVGMMTDVHMWDYVRSSCEIQNYVDNLNFSPGNVLNWKALMFEITGRVLTENKQLTCH
uniref:Pentraxin family member n=1 Tax=Poecilia mexicana TaxID=48701 RepID=A0A3B3XQE5_9TELE